MKTASYIKRQTKTSKKKPLRQLGLLALAGGASAGLVSLGAARYLVNELTKLRPVEYSESYGFTPFEMQVDYEDVEFPTANGRILKGWWLVRPGERRVVVAVSGYRGRKEEMLGIGSILWRNGYNVLLFDYRAHGPGRAEGELITLGHRELEDMQSAIKYARSRVQKPLIGLLGGSMGGSVVLLAAARDPEVRAVWADSAFSSQREVINHVWHRQTHLPGHPVLDLAEKLFKSRTGYHWNDFAPIEELSKLGNRPLFLVHGASDTMVPLDQAYRLYAAATGPKELWIEDDIEHCGVYFAYRTEYAERCLKFFGEALVEHDPVLEDPTATSPELVSESKG